MKAAERLTALLGANMAESLGVRPQGHTTPTATHPKVIAMTSPEDGKTRLREAAHIDITRIIPDPKQPRTHFPEESIEQMAESLKSRGQLQPIRVRWSQEQQSYIIISGERRFRGATKAGLKTLACIVVEGEQSETDLRIDQLVENLLREDLRPIEEAKSYRELMELNRWTVQQLADSLKIGKASVSRTLSLLSLPDDIQDRVQAGTLAPSVAYELTKLGSIDAQREMADRIAAEGMKRDEVMDAVAEATGGAGRKRPAAEPTEKPAGVKKVFDVGSARVTITWSKKTVRTKDIVAALEAALAEVKGPQTDASIEPLAAAG
jgi:ParB family chromosome partitioning protein